MDHGIIKRDVGSIGVFFKKILHGHVFYNNLSNARPITDYNRVVILVDKKSMGSLAT
ncbi:hypothetical protein ACJX0J_030517, partial [Zea mays]